MALFIRKAGNMIGSLEERVCVNIADEGDNIHVTTGLVKFVI